MNSDVTTPVSGIHHVTALAGDPRRNLDFYTDVLGLRLVKRTVNFDAPDSYHFYFGDGAGRPGTLLTFFPWPGARRGERGAGQAVTTAFSVPPGSLAAWRRRLEERRVATAAAGERHGERALGLLDPDGLRLELVESAAAASIEGWEGGSVDADAAIRGLHGVTLQVREMGPTAEVLTALGHEFEDLDGSRRRFRARGAAVGGLVDVVETPEARRGHVAVGSVHHVAFRAPDDAAQATLREAMTRLELFVTDVQERLYFRSIYFREPGGVLFEIATDGPGMAVDEPRERLGERLTLPPWLESRRAEIEAHLPPLEEKSREVPA